MARIKYIKDFYGQFTPRFLCTLEFEGHSPVGVNGHCVNSGQPELFVKLGEGVQFLHLKHESTDSFCLGFPCRLCGAELLKLCLGFFVFSAAKLLTHSLVVVTVPSATKSAMDTQGIVPLIQYSVSFRGGVFPIE